MRIAFALTLLVLAASPARAWSIDRTGWRRALSGAHEDLRACALAPGRYSVAIEIDGTGKAHAVEVTRAPSVVGAAGVSCIEAAFTRLAYPSPAPDARAGPASVAMHYPFVVE